MMFEEACFHLFYFIFPFASTWGRTAVFQRGGELKVKIVDSLMNTTTVCIFSLLGSTFSSHFDDCVRHFQDLKKKKIKKIHSLLTWMNLFVDCFFMQCWGQCLFFYWLVEIPSSISWNRCHGCKAVLFQSGFEHFTPRETHPDTLLRDW